MDELPQNKTPIALFLYNRPAHARLVLESLSQCRRLDECSLRIYCDGAKREEDAAAVEQTRKVAREWAGKLDAEVVARETNFGLARSVVDGVSELCDSDGRVIVIEDDFLLNPSFLDYMLSSLDRYASDSNVYQICGYMFPIRHGDQPDAFFLPLTTTWGWATWARAWKVFDWNAPDAENLLRDPEVRRRFNLNGAYPYAEMLESKLKGENDSWGILFWWAVFKAGGLVLHPRKSLVWNGGFDESGTHCGDQAWSTQSVSEVTGESWPDGFVFPDRVAVDDSAFKKVIDFLKTEQSQGNMIDRLRRRLLQRRGRKERQRVHANNVR
jgi:hypothetical protein